MAVLDRKSARALVAEAQDRITEVATKYGLDVTVVPTGFEPSGRFLRLDLRTMQALKVQRDAAKDAAKAQARQAPLGAVATQIKSVAKAAEVLGLPRTIVGREYKVEDHAFKVIGLALERPTKPVTILRDDGFKVAITVDNLRNRLHLKTPVAA